MSRATATTTLGLVLCIWLTAQAVSVQAQQPAAKPSPEGIEYFEKHVRPVFVEHCHKCHGEKKQQGGLRLDTKTGLFNGIDGEPVLLPGKPDESLLIQSVKRIHDYPMPPSGALPEPQVKALVAWVSMGAPYPDDAATTTPDVQPTEHWAFQPIRDPAVPASPSGTSVHPIDRFLEAKLHEKKLSFAPPAPRAVLIRRAYYDLLGLPPTAEEVQAFVVDPSPDAEAFAKLIDQLLASPHYGERWARWWLDIARYADTKGYVFTEDRKYPYAYTFRDYVIRSLNADKPYDQFVREQIAADLLAERNQLADRQDLAAMGLLTVGRRFSNNIHDIIDDRIDVVTRGFMGLTMQCARCHDHKYDPVSIGDYYSLYGVFAASTEPKDNYPIIADVKRTKEYEAFEQKIKEKEAAIEAFRKERYEQIILELKSEAAVEQYLKATRDLRGQPQAAVASLVKDRSLRPAALQRYLAWAKTDPLGKLVGWLNTPEKRQQFAQQPEFQSLFGPGGPLVVAFEEFDRLILRDDRTKLNNLKRDIDRMRASSEFNPPRAMVLNDLPKPPEQRIFQRGNPNQRGDVVPRQFVSLRGEARRMFTQGSGRLELAEAITDPVNPLTARVLVNRVWLMHFGKPLVNTPSDFGLRSDTPSHPELLDWLATRFVEDGWSLKQLHRRMMLSRAYMQSSDASAEAAERDPENRWLSHANRRRLDFESLRDSLLAVSGNLDRTIFGRSVELFGVFPSYRRAVYGLIDRQNLPGTLQSFDLPSPDTHSPQRFQTTVPQQALFLLNSPFVRAQAEVIAKQLGQQTELRAADLAAIGSAGAEPVGQLLACTPDRESIIRLYETILQRKPTTQEQEQAKVFLRSTNADGQGLALLAHILLCSNEFAFID